MLLDLLINDFLSDPAQSLVKGLESIDEIWKRLKSAYRETKVLLSRRLQHFNKMDALSRVRDPEKLAAELGHLINTIKDLMNLAQKHGIERNPYYSDALEKIYQVMGDSRVIRWLDKTCDQVLVEKCLWQHLVTFSRRK